eukprot:TRINITY_DN14136_c0_g2_i2.p1 TRINITY_DN14136_c0_g2~~TRINITY_DN14136_c0_g2_i2.p1  ORF type:complete len:246 (-),score=23.34 TRINITY_DN14136_c0_g2_i2:135-872(-)
MRFQCSVCSKTFIKPETLDTHVAKYHPDFICKICDKLFSPNEVLCIHKKPKQSKKGKGDKYSCDICNKLFVSKSTLDTHKKKYHNVPSKSKRGRPVRSIRKKDTRDDNDNIHDPSPSYDPVTIDLSSGEREEEVDIVIGSERVGEYETYDDTVMLVSYDEVEGTDCNEMDDFVQSDPVTRSNIEDIYNDDRASQNERGSIYSCPVSGCDYTLFFEDIGSLAGINHLANSHGKESLKLEDKWQKVN